MEKSGLALKEDDSPIIRISRKDAQGRTGEARGRDKKSAPRFTVGNHLGGVASCSVMLSKPRLVLSSLYFWPFLGKLVLMCIKFNPRRIAAANYRGIRLPTLKPSNISQPVRKFKSPKRLVHHKDRQGLIHCFQQNAFIHQSPPLIDSLPKLPMWSFDWRKIHYRPGSSSHLPPVCLGG